ncbi:hypothetical protein JTB14_025985 [Gonioctena quinquepunctata]|nr:hypothetical protein JTB14_025985 [Gonioctena quinquepunctata]
MNIQQEEEEEIEEDMTVEVDIDYEIVFGNGELLLNNWEKSFPNIVAFLQKDGHIKDRAAKALLEKYVKDNRDESKFSKPKSENQKLINKLIA